MWTRFSRPAKGSTKNRSLQFAHKRLTFVQTCANLTRHCSPSSPCGSRRSRPAHPLAKRVCVLRIDMHVVSSCRGRRLTLTDQTPFCCSGPTLIQPHPSRTIQFRHKFCNFHQRFFCCLLEFFNCHKFILIQREIYE